MSEPRLIEINYQDTEIPLNWINPKTITWIDFPGQTIHFSGGPPLCLSDDGFKQFVGEWLKEEGR